jgi:hypothetical protein
MSLFDAKRIEPVKIKRDNIVYEKRDLLGLDLLYARQERRVIFDCSEAIKKVAKRYGLEGAKTAKTPISTLKGKDDEPTNFPCRE